MADRKIGDMTVDELKSSLGSSPGATTGGAAKQADTGFLDNVKKAMGGVAEAALPAAFGLNKLMTGADAAASAVGGLTKGLSAVGLGSLAGVVGKVATAFLEQKTNMDAASKELGIGGNNIGTFIRMSGEAGLTTKEFTETIKKTDGLMSGLAGSSQRGAEAFSKVQKTLIESKVGEELNAIGISGKELADMTALSMSNNTKLNLKTAEGQKEAAAAAGKLATELDATSKITGQSREALVKTLEAESKKPNVILMEMQMTKEQLEGYKNLNFQMAGFGPAFQGLSAEIASGGVRTKEGLAQMAALGPAGVKFEEATKLMTNAKTKEEKDNAQAALDRAQAAINQRMASKEYNDMMQYGTAEQKAAIAGQVQGYQGLQGAQKAAQEANGDYAAGLKNQKAEAAAVEKGQKVDADGKPIKDSTGAAVMDEGAKTAQALNMANRQATIMAGGMAQQLEKTNASLGKSPAAIEAFNNSLKYVGSAKTMDQGQKQIEKTPADAVKAITGLDQAPSEKAKTGSTGGKIQKLAEGGVVEPTAGGSIVNVGEGGKAEAVIPLDKLKDVIGNVASAVSSATGASSPAASAGKASGDEPMSKLDSIKERLADRLAKVAELQKTTFDRELTEKEQGELRIANFGVRRATNNLNAELERLSKEDIAIKSIKDIFKEELVKTDIANIEDSAAKVTEAKNTELDISKLSITEQTALKKKMLDDAGTIEKASIKTSPAKPKESALDGGGLFDMLNPKIINQKAADLQKAATSQTARKTTEAAPKTAEAEAEKKRRAEYDAMAKKAEDDKKSAATAPRPSAGVGDATLKDLKDQLVTLNKNMLQLINHSESTADAAHKTAKSTAKAQGAR
jgi:hypothetical protein